MNKSMKKKALVSSILTIALCFSVIAGATLALFTSKDEVNIAVTSGKVNLTATIDTESLKLSSLGVDRTNEGKFAVGGTATFDNERKLNLTNIVPGDKATFEIDVTNNSNVDVMYKLAWKVDNTELDALVATATVENETEALEATDWIEWKTPATDAENTKTIVASIELPAGAGDEYQDKAAKVSFTVEAVQANAVVEKVSTFDQLTSAITVGVEDIALVDDIEIPLETQLVIPEGATLNLDLSGHQIVGGSYNAPSNDEGYMIVNKGTLNISGDENSLISANGLVNGYGALLNFGTMNISNVTIQGSKWDGTSGDYPGYAIRTYGITTINDGTVVDGGFGAASTYRGGTLIINGGTFTNQDITNATFYMVCAGGEGSQIIINGGNLTYTCSMANSMGSPIIGVWDGATATVNGGNFDAPWGALGYSSAAITVTGGNFKNNAVNAFSGKKVDVFIREPYYELLENADGTYTVVQDPSVFFVKDDAELAAALAAIQAGSATTTFSTTADKPYWNTNMTIVLAEGTYSGDYSINQYPEWNGVVGRSSDGNNMSTVDADDNLAIITFVGTGDAIFTGNVTVNGFGDAISTADFTDVYDRAATRFENVIFDGSTNTDDSIALYVKAAANNVTFANCTFQNASHVTLGANGSNRIGEVIFDGCEFINGNCLSGYVRTLSVTNSTATNAYNGFINVQGLSDVTVEDCTVECSEYFVRTNSYANVTTKETEIDVSKAANGLCVIANLRGDSVADFVNCKLNTIMTAGVGTLKINGVEQVKAAAANDTELNNAIANGNNVIVLKEGNYIIPASAKGKKLTIVGNGEETKVAVTKVGVGGENCDYGLDGSTVVFENLTITTNSSTYIGYARCNATYNNCTINGTYTLYGNSVFNNCTFNVSGDVYNIWTWGAPTAEFNNCTFNSDGKALLLYGTVNTNLTVNNCTFNDKGGLTDLKAAIEIGNDYGKSYTLTVNNTVVNGYEINDKGINTNSTLWANKNSMSKDNLNVVVDGVDVY